MGEITKQRLDFGDFCRDWISQRDIDVVGCNEYFQKALKEYKERFELTLSEKSAREVYDHWFMCVAWP